MNVVQVVRGYPRNLRIQFVPDGDLTDADGTVNVTITADDGTVIVDNGVAVRASLGTYDFGLEAQEDLGYLTATWSAEIAGEPVAPVTYVDVVGATYFTETEMRSLPGTSGFTDDELDLVRREVEEAIESTVAQALGKGVAFVPRYRRVVANGTATESIDLPDYFVRRVLRASIAGVALTAPQLANLVAASGQLTSTLLVWTRGMRNVDLAYEHGKAAPPLVIRRAGLLLLKEWLPALQRSSDQLSLSSARSARLDGVALSFGENRGSGDGTGVDEVDRLISTWLATPDFCSAPVA